MGKKAEVPPAIPGDVFSLTTIVNYLNQKCQFGMYYRFGVTAPTQPDSVLSIAALAAAFRASIIPSLVTTLSGSTEVLETRTYSLKWPVIATYIDPYAGTFGTRAGDPLPPQIAHVFNKQTNVRGKSGRGRSYLGGMSEADSTLGVPTAGYLAVADAVANTLNTPITDVFSGKTFYPVVVSLINYKLFDPVPVAGPFWDVRGADTVKINARRIWNTQRPRTVGKGQ
jgi:hypothetical protein